MNNNCLFCDILLSKVPSYQIYENNYVYAFLDINPVSNGHTLIIPKNHFIDLSHTNDLYIAEVNIAAKIVANKIYQKLQPLGFNFVSNEQSLAFQQVFHYHLHVIPKYKKEMGYNFKINHDEKNELSLETIHNILTK